MQPALAEENQVVPGREGPPFRLLLPTHLEEAVRPGNEGAGDEAPPLSPPDTPSLATPTWKLAGTFSAGVLAGGYVLWWQKRRFTSFDHWNEGWFGEDTYAGGADKTSHLVLGYIGGRHLQERLEKIGHTKARARLISVGMTTLGGILVEVGDGFTQYRFSWEDAVITSAGSVAGALIDSAGLSDTLGMRFGRIPTQKPDSSETSQGSTAYHHTVDTFDVHLSGLLPRLGVKPGLLRFLLVSGTYAARGYGFAEASGRQRLVGFELGLDVREILQAVGVRRETWWGGPLLFVTRFFRVPYTSIGLRYDLNHGRWLGPNAGDRYSP